MTSIKSKVTRKSKYKQVEGAYRTAIERIVASSVQDTMNTAKTSIQQHQSKGRTYGNHTASVAGNPPNSDTGFPASNISMVLDTDKLGGAVESRADYSGFLEFGTSKMGARPYLQPALDENRPKIRRKFARLRSRGV